MNRSFISLLCPTVTWRLEAWVPVRPVHGYTRRFSLNILNRLLCGRANIACFQFICIPVRITNQIMQKEIIWRCLSPHFVHRVMTDWECWPLNFFIQVFHCADFSGLAVVQLSALSHHKWCRTRRLVDTAECHQLNVRRQRPAARVSPRPLYVFQILCCRLQTILIFSFKCISLFYNYILG